MMKEYENRLFAICLDRKERIRNPDILDVALALCVSLFERNIFTAGETSTPIHDISQESFFYYLRSLFLAAKSVLCTLGYELA
jgi:hypothetical protein